MAAQSRSRRSLGRSPKSGSPCRARPYSHPARLETGHLIRPLNRGMSAPTPSFAMREPNVRFGPKADTRQAPFQVISPPHNYECRGDSNSNQTVMSEHRDRKKPVNPDESEND